MRVIKNGLIPKMTYIVTCGYCSTVFEVDKSECKTEYSQKDNEEYVMTECPVCGKRITIQINGY